MIGLKGNREFCFREAFSSNRKTYLNREELKKKQFHQLTTIDPYIRRLPAVLATVKTELSYRNDTITASSFAANRNKDIT